jgi:hypothetical protein
MPDERTPRMLHVRGPRDSRIRHHAREPHARKQEATCQEAGSHMPGSREPHARKQGATCQEAGGHMPGSRGVT